MPRRRANGTYGRTGFGLQQLLAEGGRAFWSSNLPLVHDFRRLSLAKRFV